MGTKKLVLTGCKRFNFDGKLYVDKGDDGKTQVIYEVDDKTADHLLAQYDKFTNYDFFEPYTGTEAGIKPGVVQDDTDSEESHGPKPKERVRRATNERAPRGPRPAASQSRPGKESAPIEEEGGVEV